MPRELVYILLTALAYVLSLQYVGGPSNLALLGASLLLLIVATLKTRAVVSGVQVRWGVVHGTMLAYVLFLALSVYASTLTENSTHFAWLFASFCFVFYASSDLKRDRWEFLFALFVMVGLTSAIWGILEFIETRTQANGPIVDPNLWATLNNMFFFGCLSVYLTSKSKYRVLALAALFVFATGLFAAFSRAGIAVFIAGFGFTIFLCLFVPRLRRPIAGVIALVALAFVIVNTLSPWDEARQGRETEFSLETGGFDARLLQWEGAIEIYKEHPVFGSGLGTYRLHYPQVRPISDLRTAGNFVHNDYVQLLSEAGILMVGFLSAFVMLLVYSLIVCTTKIVKKTSDDVEPVILVVAMGTALAHALLNFPLYILQVQMLLGLLFSRFVIVRHLSSVRKVKAARPRITRTATVFVALGIGLMPVLDAVSFDLVLNKDEIPIVRGIGENRILYHQTMAFLSTVRSQNWMNRHGMSTIYRQGFDEQIDPGARQALGVAAAFECQKATRLNPYQNGVREYCADLLAQNPWIEKADGIEISAEGLLREGVEIYPIYGFSYLALADYLKATNRADEAYNLLVNRALPWFNLKHATYRQDQQRLSLTVLREAKQRSDQAGLEALLEALERRRGKR